MGNETRFSQEIPVNASLQAVYIHHVVRDMTYRIQISAVNRVGEGVRSNAIVVGMLTFSQLTAGEVSSKMTYIFHWPVRFSIFFRKLFVIYFIKNFSLKGEV